MTELLMSENSVFKTTRPPAPCNALGSVLPPPNNPLERMDVKSHPSSFIPFSSGYFNELREA